MIFIIVCYLADSSRWGFVDINMWELEKIEDEGK